MRTSAKNVQDHAPGSRPPDGLRRVVTLRLSKATVYKLVAEGRLAHVRIGNSIRFWPDVGLHKAKPQV
jgi:helix-turn-helix protein